MREDLLQIARNIAESSGGRILLTKDNQGSYLQLDCNRVGRDIEVYGFMASVQGEQPTLADFAMEVVLPIKCVPASYASAVDGLKALGQKVYPAELQAEWEALF